MNNEENQKDARDTMNICLAVLFIELVMVTLIIIGLLLWL